MKRATANDNSNPVSNEGSRAQHWRQVIMGLSIKQLSELTGYSVTAIRCFEANANTSGELFGEAAWQRYRMACYGIALAKVYEACQLCVDPWAESSDEVIKLLEG